jgi:hypothetical protein
MVKRIIRRNKVAKMGIFSDESGKRGRVFSGVVTAELVGHAVEIRKEAPLIDADEVELIAETSACGILYLTSASPRLRRVEAAKAVQARQKGLGGISGAPVNSPVPSLSGFRIGRSGGDPVDQIPQ